MRFRILFCTLLAANLVYAQSVTPYNCGTEYLEELKQEMLYNRETIKNMAAFRNSVNYVPVKVHLVSLNDGTQPIPVINVLRMMCQLNKAYAEHNLQFYLKEIANINNTTISETPRAPGGSLQISLNKDSRSLNIFITNKIDNEGVAGYYVGPPGSSNDFIVIQKDYIADVRVAAHEVGHYFTLPHTFHGWDHQAWEEAKHGNPVMSKFAPDGITINELADSSNCGPKNVGDGFCDTPADYNFGSNSCSFNLQVKDLNGKVLNPQTNNFMNYFFGCDKYKFTPNQVDAVTASYASANRKNIRGTTPTSSTIITSATKLISPINGAGTLTADSVTLSWQEVAGATNYLVQWDVVPTFELLVESIITKDTKVTIKKLTQNRIYHWRVVPYNDFSTCFIDPPRFTFKAGGGTATPDIPEVKSFLVAPNPIHHDKTLTLSIESLSSFNGSIAVYSVHGGHLVFQSNEKFYAGGYSKTIDIHQWNSGAYFIVLNSGKGVATRKLMVY